ncbi:MAG: hypothetical protein MUF37_07480 [Methanoregulaceae archaeon]|jgi:hypothetical protein|nr:hypothetical protein [Methanoregulaceae archaeon]
MKNRLLAIILALTIFGTILILPVNAADPPVASATQEKVVLYATNFTTNPSWQTNNPTRYYWDPQKGMYHYLIQPGTGGYAFVPVNYNEESFTYEYDFYPIRTDPEMSFQFGMGSSEMDITRGTNVLSKFTNKKNGKLMWLQVITQNNNLAEVSSAHDSYGGPTTKFEDNETYHIIVRYNKELMNADIKVSYKNNQTVVWGYYVNFGQELHTLNRLMITSVGQYGNTESAAEGYIDNVELSIYRDVIPTPTTVPPVITTPVTTATTVPVTTTPTPTKAEALPITFILAGGIGGIAALMVNKKN